MQIAEDKVRELILLARAFDVKEGLSDPDSGSNPIDDGFTDTLEPNEEDPRELEIRELIDALNEDERAHLVALVYVGRGDFDPDQWSEAVAMARERDARGGTGDYLLGIPNLGDLLDEGLAAMGRSCV